MNFVVVVFCKANRFTKHFCITRKSCDIGMHLQKNKLLQAETSFCSLRKLRKPLQALYNKLLQAQNQSHFRLRSEAIAGLSAKPSRLPVKLVSGQIFG